MVIDDPRRYEAFYGPTSGNWLWLVSATNLSPFRLSNKPVASQENRFGNRSVDHVQFHGTALLNLAISGVEISRRPSGMPTIPPFFDGKPRDFRKFLVPYKNGKKTATLVADTVLFGACGHIRGRFVTREGISSDGLIYYHETAVAYSPTIHDIRAAYFGGYYLRSRTKTLDFVFRGHMTILLKVAQSSSVYQIRDKIFSLVSPPAGCTMTTSWSITASSGHPFEFRGRVTAPSSQGPGFWADVAEALFAQIEKIFISNIPLTSYFRSSAGSKVGLTSFRPIKDGKLDVQSLFELKSQLNRDVELWTNRNPVAAADFGDATLSSLENAKHFTGNGVAYLKEAAELKSAVLELTKLLRGRVSPKALSSLWLNYRYGIRLTALDTKEIVSGIADAVTSGSLHLGFAVSRGYETASGIRCILYYQPSATNAYFALLRFFADWDLLPDFRMLWDLIPFSFVVDWFVDVEHFVSSIDARTDLDLYEVTGSLYTVKRSVPVPPVWHGLQGPFYVSQFIRLSPNVPFQPALTFRSGSFSSKNILDGTALILTNAQ